MEHSPLLDDRVAEHEGLSLWRRMRHWLGAKTMHPMAREASETVNGQSGEQGKPQGESPQPEGAQPTPADPLQSAGAIFEKAYVEHMKATENEAGRPEGRTVPELVLGAQRYPDPRMWGPENGGVPLTKDEQYGRVIEKLFELGFPDELKRDY